MWKNKKVLVTGSEGMIGRELVEQLKELGAEPHCIDINPRITKKGWFNDEISAAPVDVTYKEKIEEFLDHFKPEFIFHLAGIKGNPKRTKEKPVDFMGPMLQFDTNMILAAQQAGVKRFLYTSSIAVENPDSDFYPAWAKKTAETLIEAMKIQYPETQYCVVRHANVYGRFDNFDTENPMVVTSLIKSGMKEGKLVLDKQGALQWRDLINAKDVARGMIKAMENMPDEPVNLCSGKGVQIAELANEIAEALEIDVEYKDLGLTLGPQKKVMSDPYIEPEVSLKEGIKEVVECVKSS